MYVKDELIHKVDITYVFFLDELFVIVVALDKQLFIW